MRITTLIENTEGHAGCACEHGLSLYIETDEHNVLMDTGQTALLLKNAATLGADLSKVDTVVVSHGHYDHGGGLPDFMRVNRDAAIYLQASARSACYNAADPGKPRYIGLAQEVLDSKRITWLSGDLQIDEELSVFAGIGDHHPVPSGNRVLCVQQDDGLDQDDFRHEQCLVISQGDRLTLLSGCAHHGILNVMDRFRSLYGRDPDTVISGFHMMQKSGVYSEADVQQIRETAQMLRCTSTVFYTGHCTGLRPYEIMKEIMGGQLHYLHCGDVLEV